MPAIFDRFCGDNHVRTVLLTRQWRFEKRLFWACIVVPLHHVVFAAGSSGAETCVTRPKTTGGVCNDNAWFGVAIRRPNFHIGRKTAENSGAEKRLGKVRSIPSFFEIRGCLPHPTCVTCGGCGAGFCWLELWMYSRFQLVRPRMN